jgi:hypothetical protein
MANINLSKFVDKKVFVTFSNGSSGIYKLAPNNNPTSSYPYTLKNIVGETLDSYTSAGQIWMHRTSSRDIADISLSPSPAKGQARPHINLEDFIGKEVYVVMNADTHGGDSYSTRMIGTVRRIHDGYTNAKYCIQGNFFKADGTRAYENQKHILEIHSADSFQVQTNGIQDPPPPVDPKVEKARGLLKDLTPEQIAALWESIPTLWEPVKNKK